MTAMMMGLLSPASAGAGGLNALNVAGITGLAASTTPTTPSLQQVPVGYCVVAYVSSGTGTATAFNDARGNTWTLTGTALSSGGIRVSQWRTVVTTQIEVSDTIGPTYAASQSCDLCCVAFQTASFDDIASAGATGTSVSPTLTLSSLDFSPEIVCFVIRSNGGLASLAASGYTKLSTAQSGNFGMQVWYKQMTGTPTYSDTFAPTGHTSVLWLVQGCSMVV